MPPTTIHDAPILEAFTPLAEHQTQTPTSFFGAKPVLHYHGIGARALVPHDQISKLPIFSRRPEGQTESATPGGDQGPVEVELVDAFISSENLTLFNNAASTGLSIPYPSISLHAIQRLPDPTDSSQEKQGLYMQLELSDPYSVSEEDEPETVELTLIPSGSDIQALFEAVSNCSNLHPDPTDEDEEMEDGGDSRILFEGNVGYEGISGLPGVQRGSDTGGLPPPFPGSGGWITAENVSEYFDEEGNFIGGSNVEVLGEGAGRVRAHEEVDGDRANGHSEDHADDNKRSRTD